MLHFIKKIAYREGGFIILEEEGFIHQQRGLVRTQGTTFSLVILVILVCITLNFFSKCNNPGARSSIYVLLDAF